MKSGTLSKEISAMVSTRGLRYKFNEGERVLCYEPDPTKAKVLYDSKVLEVIESKDKRGRRTVEYLIHFQGWNSSWDRCVSEDFVLKDTEENRQLQRDLAEKSQLQLGAYLYRRERKKGSGSSSTAAVGGSSKRTRHGFSDDGSSSSTQPDEGGETGDTDSSSGEGSGSQSHSPPPTAPGRANITLPSQLRDRLTFDYHLVVKRGKLVRLPSKPCAAEILESFVKWFARAGAWHPPRARHDPPQKPDFHDVSCRLNLVREVADGLRVYFDFVLRGHLLYKQEVNQYHEVCGQFIDNEDDTLKTEAEESTSTDKKQFADVEELIKSPKMPEYAHLPPDPDDNDKNGDAVPSTSKGLGEPKMEPQIPAPPKVELDIDKPSTSTSKPDVFSEEAHSSTAPPNRTREVRPMTRSGNVARRLRSHKSAVSHSENEEPHSGAFAGEHRTIETFSSSVGSSGSSMCEWPRAPQPAPSTATAAAPTRTPLSLLLEKVAKWEIISRDRSTEHLPCRVYGAVHLARLFVKLPDFLNATQMPDYKLKLLLKHIDMFVTYLDEHNEWFGESYYIADGTSRSH